LEVANIKKYHKKKALFTTIPMQEISIINQLPGRKVTPKDITTVEDCLKLGNSESFLGGRRQPQLGLHFLKENIPSLDILEYPQKGDYQSALAQGYDVIGISFYTTGFYAAIEMARMAREAGVKEIWAGNFGAMTPGVEDHFDRKFIGYCEADVKLALENEELKYIKHPLMTTPFTVRLYNSDVHLAGYLFTSRGCHFGCDFCSTSVFAPKPNQISIDEIERVLTAYQDRGITYIDIADETFLQYRSHAAKVIDLLYKKGMKWFCTTRADLIDGRIDELKEKGLDCVYIGVESMNNANLLNQNKGQQIGKVTHVMQELKAKGITTAGTYILGLLNDTRETIKRDLEKLKELPIDLLVFLIFTPYPELPIYKEFKEKGLLLHNDWNYYDGLHMVFKHPDITPEDAQDILEYATCSVYSLTNYNKRRIVRRIQEIRSQQINEFSKEKIKV
jgi:uncharacterized radical SAM superfamily protein